MSAQQAKGRMEDIIEEQQLFQSCEVLFGSQLIISREFLEYLQPSGLKGAYRKRAMETHPDVLMAARALPADTVGNDHFHRVQQAYEQLSFYLRMKDRRPLPQRGYPTPAAPFAPVRPDGSPWATGNKGRQGPSSRPADRPAPAAPSGRQAGRRPDYSPSENLYCGPMPQRRLLFGHFLYYSGLANWRTIARILTWQRSERPRLGELGQRFGMLRPSDISQILRQKIPFQTFGQTARNLGLLNDSQIRVLLGQQQRLQKKFGTILLEKNLVDRFELQSLLRQFEHHNATILNQNRGR